MEAKQQETKYNIHNNVSFLKNKIIFSKGSLPGWSSTIHKIENKTFHSYILDNGKTNKYYEHTKLMMFNDMKRPYKWTNIIKWIWDIRKDKKRSKLFARENLETSKILNTERQER